MGDGADHGRVPHYRDALNLLDHASERNRGSLVWSFITRLVAVEEYEAVLRQFILVSGYGVLVKGCDQLHRFQMAPHLTARGPHFTEVVAAADEGLVVVYDEGVEAEAVECFAQELCCPHHPVSRLSAN